MAVSVRSRSTQGGVEWGRTKRTGKRKKKAAKKDRARFEDKVAELKAEPGENSRRIGKSNSGAN
jgi:hypothetical protein